MMLRPASAVGQVSLLILSVILVVEAISFALVLRMPKPEAPRFTIQMAADALTRRDGKTPSTLSIRVVAVPSAGPRAGIVEQALVLLLGKPADEVRAFWIEPEGAGAPFTIVAPGGRRAPHGALLLMATLPLPAFSAAIRKSDGRWLVAEPTQSLLAAWQVQMLAALILSAALLVPLSIFAARRLTIPLRRLEDFALEDGPVQSKRDLTSGPRELRAVFKAIVRMRERLAARAQERVRMLAAVAHDLRTPLTGLRLRMEDVIEPDRTRMIEDADRMERMIEHMLAYARDDHPRTQPRMINVADELAQVRASFPADHIEITSPHRAGEFWIDPQDFQRAIGNLVHNAVTYGDAASIEAETTAATLTVTIHDKGPGIPPEEWERVLLPFERGEGSRNRHTGGVGLGLSSAHDIAWKYGGHVYFRKPSKSGFTVAIVFRSPEDVVAGQCMPAGR